MQDSRIKYKEFLPPASLLYKRLRPKRSYAAGFTAALSDPDIVFLGIAESWDDVAEFDTSFQWSQPPIHPAFMQRLFLINSLCCFIV
ncbi:MAG: hypothetical protein KME55_05650 [Nostoc indistinguendum CM1-VF10]|jgi:hypothetical protein|nr:hypothetical protein [Nostoc indistinguendum CM1-VF10]